jgi:Ni,Fe-hydrogenase I large subunit
LGKGCGNYLAFGGFPLADDSENRFFPAGVLIDGKPGSLNVDQITEEVACSKFSSATGLAPAVGETTPAPTKANAYSWLKAPRYAGQPMEVGSLARMLVAYYSGKSPEIKAQIDAFLTAAKLPASGLASVLGRHVARAIEARLLAAQCAAWLDQLRPDEPSHTPYKIPESAKGYGLVEAPRGALGHWIEIKNRVIARYQCVVPTTWNCSPRDDRGVPGPVEQALVDVPVANVEHPIETARVIRSFDPCIACAVH